MTVGSDGLGNGFSRTCRRASIPACSAYLQLPIDKGGHGCRTVFALFDFNYETAIRPVTATAADGMTTMFGINGAEEERNDTASTS